MHQGYSRNQPVESMELGWSWLENTRAPPHVDFGTFARIIITMTAREGCHLNTSCFGTLAEMTDTVSLENGLVHSHLTVHITVVFSLFEFQVSHKFSEYGSGLRYISFEHGGQDSKFWDGWFGVRVTGSSVTVDV